MIHMSLRAAGQHAVPFPEPFSCRFFMAPPPLNKVRFAYEYSISLGSWTAKKITPKTSVVIFFGRLVHSVII